MEWTQVLIDKQMVKDVSTSIYGVEIRLVHPVQQGFEIYKPEPGVHELSKCDDKSKCAYFPAL